MQSFVGRSLAVAAAVCASSHAWASGGLPLRFEPNVGQIDRGVRYMARGRGYRLHIGNRGAARALAPGPATATSVVGMRLANTSGAVKVVGEKPQTGKTHYFIGR